MRWTNKGPALDDSDIRHFESRVGYPLPEPMVWFLSNVANGGHPIPLVEIPVEGDEEMFALHGLYGINHPSSTYDMWGNFDVFPERTAIALPVGFDGCNGQLMYMLHGPQQGQVRHMTLDAYHDPMCTETFFVAPDMRTFAQLIEAGQRP